MVCSKNVVNANILHVHWDSDCLVFCFMKSKGDQAGRNRDQEWHVYANPQKPAISPVFALRCYVFGNPGQFCCASYGQEKIEEQELLMGGENAFFLAVTKTSISWIASVA